jgi:hypothetical protein
MAKINYRQLKLEIDKGIERNFRQKAIEVAEHKFEEAKDEFLEKFLEHPISEELKGGIDEQSSMLGVPGSLFAFIGFDAGTNPIGELYDFLSEYIKINKTPTYNKSKSTFEFKIRIPSKETIADRTPMPWGTHRSWVFAIETGISGLNQYLSTQKYEETFGRSPATPLGRSEGGIQIKVPVNGGGFKPRRYMSNLLGFLEKALKQ